MENIDIVFQITKKFQRDYKKFDSVDQKMIDKAIDKVGKYLSEGNFLGLDTQKIKFQILDYNSNIYLLRASRKIRFFLTIEEDPVFEQILITLHRVFQAGDLHKIVRSIQESLMQEYFGQEQGEKLTEDECNDAN